MIDKYLRKKILEKSTIGCKNRRRSQQISPILLGKLSVVHCWCSRPQNNKMLPWMVTPELRTVLYRKTTPEILCFKSFFVDTDPEMHISMLPYPKPRFAAFPLTPWLLLPLPCPPFQRMFRFLHKCTAPAKETNQHQTPYNFYNITTSFHLQLHLPRRTVLHHELNSCINCTYSSW